MVSASRMVGEVLATVEDVSAPVERGNPFWIPLWEDAGKAPVKVPEYTEGQLATLHGDTDGVTWTATAWAERVQIGRGKYELGWSRLIAFEAGFFTTPSGIGVRLEQGPRLPRFSHWPHVEEDLAPVLERAARAALNALGDLERGRCIAQRFHMQSESEVDFRAMSKKQLLREVARVYDEAAALGIRARRGQVERVLNLSTRTATRRIAEAREAGYIKEDSE